MRRGEEGGTKGVGGPAGGYIAGRVGECGGEKESESRRPGHAGRVGPRHGTDISRVRGIRAPPIENRKQSTGSRSESHFKHSPKHTLKLLHPAHILVRPQSPPPVRRRLPLHPAHLSHLRTVPAYLVSVPFLRPRCPCTCSFHTVQYTGRDRKSTRLNSSHSGESRMPSSA